MEKQTMSETFAELFKQSLSGLDMQVGSVVSGLVVSVDDDFVLVDAGNKSESFIPIEQFRDKNGELDIAVGQMVEVVLDDFDAYALDGQSATRLSREKAKKAEVWKVLEAAQEKGQTVIGIITGKVKGGFTVDLEGVRAFLPGSLIDVRPLRDTTPYENRDLEFKVIKIDSKRNNVVVSRRAVIEEENSAERDALLGGLEEGSEVKGIVKNLTDYGAFIDLGGIDGLLHITDMSWKRIRHPSELLNVGDEITVRVLKFDKERARVSLGLKQLGSDPWVSLAARFPVGRRVHGRITNVADYGCFVELESGVEGLVHVSEMDWTNKNANPHKLVQLDQEVDVIVLDVDEDRRRISLGMKQCIDNPWQSFEKKYAVGSRVKGVIKSITDFGIFIGLDGSIDGLIHLSDLSWTEPGEEAVKAYSKGQNVEASVLAVDAERERISLGVKQCEVDPLGAFLSTYDKGSVVKGTITAVDEKGLEVQLDQNVKGTIRAAECSRNRVNPSDAFKVGESVEACMINVDRKNSTVVLSIRALEEGEDKDSQQLLQQMEDRKTTTIGDLIKEKMKH